MKILRNSVFKKFVSIERKKVHSGLEKKSFFHSSFLCWSENEAQKKDSVLKSIEMYLDRNPGLTEDSILFKIQQKLEDKSVQVPFKVAKLRAGTLCIFITIKFVDINVLFHFSKSETRWKDFQVVQEGEC